MYDENKFKNGDSVDMFHNMVGSYNKHWLHSLIWYYASSFVYASFGKEAVSGVYSLACIRYYCFDLFLLFTHHGRA